MQKQHSFHDAMQIELKFEGGKDDDPVDPGGRTDQGITQRVFSSWLISHGKPSRDVFTMTDAERDEIFDECYGEKIRFDDMPPGVDVVLLDGAINSGPSQSVKWCQRALGLTADGVLGMVTMQRIIDHPDHDKLIADILDRRMLFLRSLRTFDHFGGGWTSRVDQLRRTGQLWAMGSVGPPITFVPNGNKKALIVDAKRIPSTAPADATAAGGTVTTGLATVQSMLSPLQGKSPIIDNVLFGLLVAGVVLSVFGFVYAYWVRQRRSQLEDALDLVTRPGAADNDNVPPEVVAQYTDPTKRGSETGNIAPGRVTTSGRVAGDTETKRSVA